MIGNIGALLDKGDFAALFVGELGWDNPGSARPVRALDPVTDQTLTAMPVAGKRGVMLYRCDGIPDSRQMDVLDRAVSKRSVERLIVFCDGQEQRWRWPEPRRSGGVRYVTHFHTRGKPNPALTQRLAAIRFRLSEEDSLTVLGVRERVRSSFNADDITKRFYTEFKSNQEGLVEEIEGIPGADERTWYSSLLLNRLMFIYFMQRKSFLNDDSDYLRSSLKAIRGLRGPGHFYKYYRDFLLPLFHDGLGSDTRKPEDPAVARVMGDVPYINGGIFAVHPLETAHEIDVPDEAFERIFDFFDRYRWHLDERPSGDPTEINPDVLGYIFEQYVNQKAQGAYYTKEDVTGYMTAATVLPLFLERLHTRTGVAPWLLLQGDPARYISEALAHGVAVESPDLGPEGDQQTLPGDDIALPGEKWVEVFDRRAYFQQLSQELSSGAVADADTAVTLNLELLTLALDYVGALDAPSEVAEAWSLLQAMTILDPTCGSGAFLFAALDLLEELYVAVLDRARQMVAEGRDTKERALALLLDGVDSHASQSYFVLKTAVLSNLYGVDIMEEATEIARLRLFLAMAARLDSRSEIEPLPDLDMNIRPGNLLVGCTTPVDARARFQHIVLASRRLPDVDAAASVAADFYSGFIAAQQAGASGDALAAMKAQLRAHEQKVSQELDLLYVESLATGWNVEAWKESHQPFHWFIEFPSVMANGGFDVIIGNPPYIKKSLLTRYRFSGFKTDSCPDIFAPCMERAADLVSPDGRFSMIVPISFQFSDDYGKAREAIADTLAKRWVSTYSRNPSALFYAGLGVRNTILLGRRGGSPETLSTDTRRWPEEFRPYLFDTNRYAPVHLKQPSDPWPRLGHPALADLYERLTTNHLTLGQAVQRGGSKLGFKKIALYYLSVFLDEPPAWMPSGKRIPQIAGQLYFRSDEVRDVAFMLLAGRMAFWWWGISGDDFNVPSHVLKTYPIHPDEVKAVWPALRRLAVDLRAEQLRQPSVTKYAGKEIGNYDMTRCRHITDKADQLVLNTLGLGDLWEAVLLADARLAKITGERPGTEREWPFEWTPGDWP